MGSDGDIFNREGTPWPEADITIVDLATYALEGYNAQLSIAYIATDHNQQPGRTQPIQGPAHRQTDGRRPYHHQKPAALPLRGEDHQNMAKARRLVLAGHAKHRRPAPGGGTDAEHYRVANLPGHAAGRS